MWIEAGHACTRNRLILWMPEKTRSSETAATPFFLDLHLFMRWQLCRYGFCLLFLWGMVLPVAKAQSLKRKKVVRPDSSFVLDSLTLILPTLKCISDSSVSFTFDFKTNRLKPSGGVLRGDSLVLEYRTYPFAAWKPVYRFSRNLYDSVLNFADYPGIARPEEEKREELFALPGIQKNGAITRGISLGNNQNGFVNSSLNLQLEGYISPQIRLTAVLSDQNIPFQPQGNTQQIRELDRILIQLDHRNGQLQAGDVVLKNEPSQFLRFFKNIQGGQASAYWDSVPGNSQTRIAGGVAKGKFASVVVQVREGVQGPYRLRPPDNPDLTVIILANSERIYFDNRLLKRGFNQDYVIDYNTGELTLNNNLLVTQFTRLRCDFEYAERNYNRSTWLAEHMQTEGRSKFRVSHYQEQDNPSRPLGFTLDSLSDKILREAGDDPSKSVLPAFTRVDNFTEGQLLYTRKDTLLGGVLVPYFLLANRNDAILFQVAFSDAGPGKGDYILLDNLGNGKAFRYAGPGKGNFLPVRQAVLPNLRSLSTTSWMLDMGKGHRLEAEGAWSRFDKNRFSALDQADNQGNAQFLGYNWNSPENKKGLNAHTGIAYTRLSKNFNAIDRFRPIEFDRDWNANAGDTLASDDHLLEAKAGLDKKDQWWLAYQGALRDKGINVKGMQHSLSAGLRTRSFLIQNQAFMMINERPVERAGWNRLRSELAYVRYGIIPSYQFHLDENKIFNTARDSATRTAMHFKSHTLSFRAKDSSRHIFQAGYTYREDEKPVEGIFRKEQFSQQIFARAARQFSGTQRMDFFLNYRQIHYAGFTGLKNDENLSGRIDYSGSFWEGAMLHELTYTANTGQEQRRVFQFIRINAIGEGTHQWIDFNNNGLQELDEFVEAQRPEDRVYIKIFTPTGDFIKAYSNSLNYRLNLGAPFSWRNAGGLRGFFSRFALLTSIQNDQKTVSGSLANRYLPFQNIEKQEIVASNQVLRNTVFWNRTQSGIGGDYSLLRSRQKTLLSNGFTLRQVTEHRFQFRKNLGQYFNLVHLFSWFERKLNSDALLNQNYAVEGWELGPEMSFQPNANHRISGSGVLGKRQNRLGEEKSEAWRLGLEYRYNHQTSRTLNANLRLTGIRYSGPENGPASYEILEGLRPGQNLTWGINLQQKLAQGLQLLFTYEGRKSEGVPVIHLGKMQASLLF